MCFGETTGVQTKTNKTQSVELMNIYVANVPYSVKDQDLRELFEPYGEVTSAKVIMDKVTNRSRGFGFVEMSDENAGRTAIEQTNGKNFHGRDLVVNEARPRTEGDRPSFGGGGGGRSFGGGGGDRGGYGGGGDRGGDRGGYRGGDRGGDRGGADRGGERRGGGFRNDDY
jgi:RNA recognition motif-containing protein